MEQATRIASVLRRAREERGLSLEDAAADAGIPLRYARLLEGESADSSVGISDELYLIPFFRRYARLLGMNPEDMLTDLVGEVEAVGSHTPVTRLSYRSPFHALWKPFGLGLVAAIAVALILRQGPVRPAFDDERWSDHEDRGVAASPAIAASTQPPERGVDTRVAAQGGNVGGAANDLAGERAAAATAPAPQPPSAPAAADQEAADPQPMPAANARELRITAAEQTWLSLGIDEEPKKNILLQPGETRTWMANGTFVLTLGNAGGVTIVLDGRELPPLGKSGQVVRNLRLPEGEPRAPSEG